MNNLSCVIDCLDYGDQTATARESAEIGEDVSDVPEEEASNEVVQVRTPRPRDQSLYLFYD